MGDGSDIADLNAFMRSKAGKRRLQAVRRRLLRSPITSVTFSNDTWVIGAEIRFADGKSLSVWLPEFDLKGIRENHPEIIDRLYEK